jgi:hypothetical protein
VSDTRAAFQVVLKRRQDQIDDYTMLGGGCALARLSQLEETNEFN